MTFGERVHNIFNIVSCQGRFLIKMSKVESLNFQEDREELAKSVKDCARLLGKPLSETVQLLASCPLPDLEILLNRDGVKINTIDFSKKPKDPTNLDPFPPAA